MYHALDTPFWSGTLDRDFVTIHHQGRNLQILQHLFPRSGCMHTLTNPSSRTEVIDFFNISSPHQVVCRLCHNPSSRREFTDFFDISSPDQVHLQISLTSLPLIRFSSSVRPTCNCWTRMERCSTGSMWSLSCTAAFSS